MSFEYTVRSHIKKVEYHIKTYNSILREFNEYKEKSDYEEMKLHPAIPQEGDIHRDSMHITDTYNLLLEHLEDLCTRYNKHTRLLGDEYLTLQPILEDQVKDVQILARVIADNAKNAEEIERCNREIDIIIEANTMLVSNINTGIKDFEGDKLSVVSDILSTFLNEEASTIYFLGKELRRTGKKSTNKERGAKKAKVVPEEEKEATKKQQEDTETKLTGEKRETNEEVVEVIKKQGGGVEKEEETPVSRNAKKVTPQEEEDVKEEEEGGEDDEDEEGEEEDNDEEEEEEKVAPVPNKEEEEEEKVAPVPNKEEEEEVPPQGQAHQEEEEEEEVSHGVVPRNTDTTNLSNLSEILILPNIVTLETLQAKAQAFQTQWLQPSDVKIILEDLEYRYKVLFDLQVSATKLANAQWPTPLQKQMLLALQNLSLFLETMWPTPFPGEILNTLCLQARLLQARLLQAQLPETIQPILLKQNLLNSLQNIEGYLHTPQNLHTPQGLQAKVLELIKDQCAVLQALLAPQLPEDTEDHQLPEYTEDRQEEDEAPPQGQAHQEEEEEVPPRGQAHQEEEEEVDEVDKLPSTRDDVVAINTLIRGLLTERGRSIPTLELSPAKSYVDIHRQYVEMMDKLKVLSDAYREPSTNEEAIAQIEELKTQLDGRIQGVKLLNSLSLKSQWCESLCEEYRKITLRKLTTDKTGGISIQEMENSKDALRLKYDQIKKSQL